MFESLEFFHPKTGKKNSQGNYLQNQQKHFIICTNFKSPKNHRQKKRLLRKKYSNKAILTAP